MSKRGTENQITKDDYEREEEHGGTQEMGTFKKASNEELARRPMKALRRAVPRTSSNLSDDGTKRASPFAVLGTSPASSSQSSQTSIDEPAKPAKPPNPFAGFTFGIPSAPMTSASTSAPSSQPTFSFGGFGQPPVTTTPATGQETSGMKPSMTTGATSAPISTSSFSKNAFTFNIGSRPSAPTDVDTDSSINGDGSSTPVNREQYERLLRAMNMTFLKKVQKELEKNPIVNLSQIFNQYTQHRVRARVLAQEEEQEIRSETDSIERENTSEDAGTLRITRIGAGGVNSPKMGFGLPFDITNNAEDKKGFSFTAPKTDDPTSVPGNSSSTAAPSGATSSTSGFPSLASASPFAFGSSSVKGAVDPPKNPTAFNFGIPSSNPFGASSTATSTATASSTPSMFSFGTPKPFASSNSTPMSSTAGGEAGATLKPFAFANPAPTGISTGGAAPKPFAFSNPEPTSNSSGGEAPKPFGFFNSSLAGSSTGGGSKPFLFSNSALTSNNSPRGSAAPKPFAFQVPPTNATSPSSFSDTAQEGDNEKMPDDTKSQLVDNREGEEDEETVFEVRAKLYGVVEGANKDLGIGQFRVNENTETKKRRMIMRTAGTGLITLNSWIIQGMSAKRDKAVVTLFAIEDGKPKRFMLRVKEEASAEELLKALEAAQLGS
ncbi:hypothetical protein BGZ65_008285 [Modicella reniformis]|uniref:RanBD1 domain-containing protein n=1 Tax=Modicella reniformis TaxID=1440133 RepID=A0A9P6SUX0_9FUNG|nr:hypothetical protein BGZ65_008285 [Modicella reniformis]